MKLVCGDDVYDVSGEYVGEVEDLMFDTAAGRVTYAVVAAGGFLGLGQKRYAIPWSAISFDSEYKKCMLNIDQAELLDAPTLDDNHWLHAVDPSWAEQIQAYFAGHSRRA
jgi:hypothetical protein